MVEFEAINPAQHRSTLLHFRRETFRISFGSDADFNGADYLQWLTEQTAAFPDGFVLAKESGKWIGQLELSIRTYEERKIGYIHHYYLIAAERGKEKGTVLYTYAMNFFKKHGIDEYHLRVSPSNLSAIRFYRKTGMEEVGPEINGKVVRMSGKVR
ncbi:GNAT family N-acetyltransferase [Planococcus lenghuensis]|uniref:GNAT family N-acetyltransferase n=1 Tax=Planococcus lenghuensis TaxID=2213202 RepID=A0A1Q2KYH1_9BACL|nr:GNAT family N-acetyltransferase [Planococcus lenghuensis]AQQ53154.1 GNAT family N-acetyltransferase [Planococcus lenghuensis]